MRVHDCFMSRSGGFYPAVNERGDDYHGGSRSASSRRLGTWTRIACHAICRFGQMHELASPLGHEAGSSPWPGRAWYPGNVSQQVRSVVVLTTRPNQKDEAASTLRDNFRIGVAVSQ
jgi:hypothetical protein